MTRIIAGRVGGRTIAVPPGRDTRPTSDRVREALFSSLAARGVLDGARVLDLYAGSGALGLEAASRGARSVVLVEAAPAALRVCRRNAQTLALDGVVVRAGKVAAVLAAPHEGDAFDLVLLDPPYALTEADLAGDLAALAAGRWLAPGATVVVERSVRSPEPSWPPAWSAAQQRTYGQSALWFVVASRPCAASAPAPSTR